MATQVCKFVNHISINGGLFIGPQAEDATFTKMFKHIISEEEGALGLHVTRTPTSAEDIARKAKVPVDEAEKMLKHMAQKGVVFERIAAGRGFYNITPFIPGFYEYVMTDPETKNDPYMAELFTDITSTGTLMRLLSGQDGGLLKVTPVMKEIDAQRKVYSFEDVMTFLNNATPSPWPTAPAAFPCASLARAASTRLRTRACKWTTPPIITCAPGAGTMSPRTRPSRF